MSIKVKCNICDFTGELCSETTTEIFFRHCPCCGEKGLLPV